MNANLNNFAEILNISNFSEFKSFIFSKNFTLFSNISKAYILEIGAKNHKLLFKNNETVINTNQIDILLFEQKYEDSSYLYNVNLKNLPFLTHLENIKKISIIPLILQNRLKYLIIIPNIKLEKSEFLFLSKILNLIFQNISIRNIDQRRNLYINRIFSIISSTIIVRDKNFNIILVNKNHGDDVYKCYDLAFGFSQPCKFCPINSYEITKEINKKYFKIQQTFLSPYFLCIVEDITSLIKLKEEFSKSEKLSLLGKIASEITHEIKNPLNSIKLKTTLLEKLIKNEDTHVKKTFQSIQHEIDRLSNLLNDFLQFGKNSVLNKVDFDFVKLINEIIFEFQETFQKESIKIEFKKNISSLIYTGDVYKIKQVLINLIKNSVEALREIEYYKKIIIELQKEKKRIKILIKDNGKGVKEIEKLFTPFFTTKYFGTGLGLSIAKKNLELHNATINYKREDSFSIFEIIFKI